MFGKNDLYFIFLMKARKDENTIIKQETEISECEWVPCKEVVERAPLFSPIMKRVSKILGTNLETAEKVIEKYKEMPKEDMLSIMTMTKKTYKFRNRNNYLYLGQFIKDCIKLSSKI